MLNFNLTKNDIAYLRLLLDIESYDDDKKNTQKTVFSTQSSDLKSVYDDFQANLLKNRS